MTLGVLGERNTRGQGPKQETGERLEFHERESLGQGANKTGRLATGTPLLSYLGMLDFSAPVSASETQDKTSQREWIQWAYPKPGAEPVLINGAVIPVNKTRACPQACHNPDTQIITIQ